MDMRTWLPVGLGMVGAALLIESASVAAKQPKDTPPPPQVNALLACRAISDNEQRLACYDKNAATVGEAVAKRELVVIDRESVKQTKRGLFGFSIPNLGIFGDDGDEDEIKQIDGEIVATGLSAD